MEETPILAHQLESQKPGSEWIVFSDRDDNPTYQKADVKSDVKKRMQFMESFLVIEQTEDFIHIVKWTGSGDVSHSDKGNYRVGIDLPDYGWAPKQKMLLWKNALVDEETKFTIKALSVNSVKSLRDPQKYARDQVMKIFNEPGLSHLNGNEVRMYDFLYIYKKVGNSYLIGKSYKLTSYFAANERTC